MTKMPFSILKIRRFASSMRTLHQPARLPLRGSGLPRQAYPLRSMLWSRRCRRRKVLRSRDSHSWNCSQAMSDQSFCMAGFLLRHGDLRVVFRKRRQLVEMVILAPVLVVRKGLLEPCGVCQRVVPKLHGNRLTSYDLPEEHVERRGHGNANSVEDDVGPALDGIFHPEVDLNGCCSFHDAYYIKIEDQMSIRNIANGYTTERGCPNIESPKFWHSHRPNDHLSLDVMKLTHPLYTCNFKLQLQPLPCCRMLVAFSRWRGWQSGAAGGAMSIRSLANCCSGRLHLRPKIMP